MAAFRPGNAVKVTDAGLVAAELGAAGRADGITSARPLSGGVISDVLLIGYADGSRIVAKTLTGAPGDLFAIEAEGLAALRATGQLDTPRVLGPGRMPILHLRELLSTVAHFGTEAANTIQRIHHVLTPFRIDTSSAVTPFHLPDST